MLPLKLLLLLLLLCRFVFPCRPFRSEYEYSTVQYSRRAR